MLVDVMITWPCSDAKIRSLHTDTKSSAAATDGENFKRNKYSQFCSDNDLHFTPLIFETYGTWGPELITFVEKVVKTSWHKRGKSIKYSVWMEFWVKRLSVCLQVNNAKLLNSRALSAAGGTFLRDKTVSFTDTVRHSEVCVSYNN
jgi:hypothetical protein